MFEIYSVNLNIVVRSENNSALLNPSVTKRNKCLEATAYFQIAFGIVVFCAGMLNNIHGLIDTSKGEHWWNE